MGAADRRWSFRHNGLAASGGWLGLAGLRSSSRVLRLGTMLAVAGSLVVTGVGTGLGVSGVALAQVTPGFDQANPDAQMFLEADELLYNEGVNTVTALGNVTIFYDGYTVDADEVVYDRAQGRVLARKRDLGRTERQYHSCNIG